MHTCIILFRSRLLTLRYSGQMKLELYSKAEKVIYCVLINNNGAQHSQCPILGA
jgi:hypothetical protein